MKIIAPALILACLSGHDLALLKEKRERAVAAGCSDSVAVPGSSIGTVHLDQAADSAKRANGIDFDVESGRVVRIRHTAANACVSPSWLAPLIVIDAKTDLAPFADCARAADGKSAICPFEGIALVRTANGTRVEIMRRAS